MFVVDKLCYSSKLRYVNPYEKFFFAMLSLIFTIASRSIALGLLVMGVNSYITVIKGGISWRRYKRLMSIPLVFLVLSTVAIIINFSRTPLDAFAINFGGFYLTSSFAGIHKGVQLIVTALASVSCLYYLSLNTTMVDILAVLKGLKLPDLIVELMMLIYRFIFVLLETASAISTAQNSRLGNKDYKTSMRSFGKMVQALFIRAMKRSSLLYDAMEARCYDGKIQVLRETKAPNGRNVAFMAVYQFALLLYTIGFREGLVHLI